MLKHLANIAEKDKALFFLRLLHLGNFTADKFSKVSEDDITPKNLQNISVETLYKWGLTKKQAQKWQTISDKQIDKDLQWLEQENHYLMTIVDDDYPALLKEISDPPVALFILGNKHLLNHPQLAIVGSRTPTPLAKDTAYRFAECLANIDLIITSGMALGIDASSHRGALTKAGKTIAVCGTGLDRVYPAKHRELARQIAENGALVSEFPIGAKPQPYHFPRRNRIISGLSLGTLIVEAALNSGSLITARLAMEQGREVFAIPGSIHNPLAHGCHGLIRQGAKLVEKTDDILEELAPMVSYVEKNQPDEALENAQVGPILDKESQHLLSCMDYDAMPIDVLVMRSGLKPESVSSILLLLELQSLVHCSPGGYSRI